MNQTQRSAMSGLPQLNLSNTTAQGLRSTKQIRVKKISEEEYKTATESYINNSNKELLCLEYVKNFRKKFKEYYPQRKDVFLTARNEFGVEKFVCTTLRPTQLPFREVYGMEDCAEFVAHFLTYEPLEEPTMPPSCLPSLTQVLEWGVGDSFDFSLLLASYLIGSGYDAFVVIGFAPKWVTTLDQSSQSFPDSEAAFKSEDEHESELKEGSFRKTASARNIESKKNDDNADDEKDEDNPYKLEKKGVPVSRYLQEMEEKRLAAEAKVESQWESDDEEECLRELAAAEEEDELRGQRVHAWVLVRGGKRKIEEMLFVESTTGRIYPVSQSPYISIEAIFNSKNYFVNIQPEKAISSISFDVLNNDYWEYVLLDSQTHSLRYREDDEYGQGHDGALGLGATGGLSGNVHGTEADIARDIEDENLLDIPPSWVDKLVIDRDIFELRYPPDGQRTIFYLKAKLELFSERIHDTCMIARLTLFKDKEMLVVKEVRERFSNRKDHLVQRIRYPLEGKLKEYFEPGRQHSLQKIIQWTGRRRELHFYVSARDDGLTFREEEFDHKVIEHFSGRGDHLIYRSATYATEERGVYAASDGPSIDNQHRIRKMTQKFERDPSIPARQNVAKRKFLVTDGLIRSTYHYEEEAVTSRVTIFVKERSIQVPKIYAQDERVPMDDREEYINAEKQCLKEMKDLNSEVSKILVRRIGEERHVERVMPLFEKARTRRHEQDAEEGPSDINDQGDHGMVDYLTPFLQNISNPRHLSQEEAIKARDACLKALKDRLIERANIIQNKLNEENAELSKKQANFERNQRDNNEAAEEDFQREMQERVFRIQILERRLQQHEEAALKKYADMDEKLTKDPRLAVLNDRY